MRKALMLGIISAIAASGCSAAHGEGQGPAVDRNYSVGNFDRIELAGSYDVTVRTGTAPSVKAHGDAELLDRLTVEVRNGILTVKPKSHGWSWGNHRKVTMTITVPSLRGAELAGAGDIHVDQVKGDRFDGSLEGSGNLTIDRLEVAALSLGIHGAGGATVHSGHAASAQYDIAGSGDIDAKGVTTETAALSIAGAGSVKANAAKTAAVSIMGAGDVDLTGGAKCTISKAGAGNVRCS